MMRVLGTRFAGCRIQQVATRSLAGKRLASSARRKLSGVRAMSQPASVPGLVDNVWQQNNQRVKYEALNEDVTADVVVVGAGIAGLSVAYNLATMGRRVVVLEAGVRGGGMTGRTTAHIMHWNDDFYSQLQQQYGDHGAKLVAEAHVAAKKRIKDIVHKENIDCDYLDVDGYLFPHSPSEGMQRLKSEMESAKKLGLGDVEWVDLGGGPEVGGVESCLKFPQCADFNPLKYLEGLSSAIERQGGRIFELTRVTETHNGKLKTSTGHTAKATSAVVLATNSPITRNVAVHARQEPYRSYVVGFELPTPSAVKRAQFWDTDEPYHYARIVDYKDNRKILIVGGQDHPVGIHPDKYNDNYERLIAWTKTRWTNIGEPVFRWTGMVYEPAGSLGMYGPDPLNLSPVPHYIVTGHSGQGMTGATIASLVIADFIGGRPNRWADLYSPSRVLPDLKNPSSLVEEALHTAKGLAENLELRSRADVVGVFNPHRAEKDLKAGEGAVLQEGARKVAVYRAADGSVSRRSAVCPHLGCMVEWNPVDHTFDCPCHGSLYDCHGRLIVGPSTSDLEDLCSKTAADAPAGPGGVA